jgi:hypothetical protein
VIHDGDPVAQPFSLLHVVCGEQYGAALGLELLDQVPELAAGLGVETGGRLVEEEQLRIAHQGAGQGHPLLLPARELADSAAPLLVELHLPDHRIYRRPAMVEAAE